MITTLKSIFKAVVFFIFMILVVDIGGAIYTKVYYKGGIDFCAKVASMEIIRDDEYAKGIIKINEAKAEEEFKNAMELQFKLTREEIEEGTVYAQAINTVPSIFTHPLSGKEYIINKPMFVVIFRVRKKGVFINNNILIDNLSGSQVTLKRN